MYHIFRPAPCFELQFSSNGPIGATARAYIERGQLVPDDVSIEI